MIELRTLGALDLRGSDGREVRSVLAQPRRVALLSYLAIASPRGFHRRDALLALFWPEHDQEHARGSLRQALHFLRHSLGEAVLLGRGDEELGLCEERCWCDAVAFERAVEAGREAEALALYRSDLLEGFFITEAPEFEHWVEGERARLRARASEAAWAIAGKREAEGNAVEAARWGRRATALGADDESTLCRLVTLLDRLGDRVAAVRAYEAFSWRLWDQHEMEPSRDTKALIESVRWRQERCHAISSSPLALEERPGLVGRDQARVVEDTPLPSSVPPDVLADYREAGICASAGAWRAAAALLRSTLDKTLRANGYGKGQLVQRLDEAAREGVITAARRRRACEIVRVLTTDVLRSAPLHVTAADVAAAQRYVRRILEDFYDDRPSVEAVLVARGRLPAPP